MVARISGMDVSSVTGRNILNIKEETGLSLLSSPLSMLNESLRRAKPVPEYQQWRLPLLQQYVEIRDEQRINLAETDVIDGLIASLCTS